jgi:hypothetical protein
MWLLRPASSPVRDTRLVHEALLHDPHRRPNPCRSGLPSNPRVPPNLRLPPGVRLPRGWRVSFSLRPTGPESSH